MFALAEIVPKGHLRSALITVAGVQRIVGLDIACCISHCHFPTTVTITAPIGTLAATSHLYKL